MKILRQAADVAKSLFIAAVEGVGTPIADVEKRDGGVFVSRPLDPANAQKWHDWAVKHGIPKPVPVTEMHVTVIYSLADVKLARDERAKNIRTDAGYGDAGAFCMFGPKNDALVFCFDDWELYNRHHEFVRNGGVTTWPSYRPHLTLSTDAAGFELSDEALAEVPTYIVLLGEMNADVKKVEDIGDEDGAEEPETGDETLIIVIDIAKAAAKTILEEQKAKRTLPAMDLYALADIEKGRVSRGVAKRLALADWTPPEIKELAKAEKKTERVLKSVELQIGLDPIALADVSKSVLHEAGVFKTDEDRRLVWSIASVSTLKGEKYYDPAGEHFSTRALEEFMIDLTKSGGSGKFEHEGEAVNRIVQGLVLSNDLQKALGIDLGMEPLVVCTEIHESRWEEAKKGGYRDSIAGRFYYYEDE